MSDSRAQNPECPLCMEPFEVDDFSFFPCTCGYQICRFCWHRIRTDENGLCPACRKQYPEDPADFKPLSVEELQKIKIEKRQKDQQKKNEMSENRKHLSGVRVVQKNLVFVVGLPTRLADTEVLKKHDYFGKFGKIQKVTVNQSTNYAGYQAVISIHRHRVQDYGWFAESIFFLGPSASAYVTYCKSEDALQAIKAVNNLKIDGRIMKASLGTTKYCSHFLKNQQCRKADCVYLHELGDEVATGKKKDISKDIASPTAQKKPQSCKEVCPSPPQNSKLEQAKESPAVKQPRSKSKNASSEGQKSRKIKDKSDHLSNSKISTIKNTKNREGSCLKSNSKPEKLSKDCNSSPSPLQRTERSVCRNIVSDNKHSLDGMNSKNVQKTEVHISEQSVQSTFRASSASPSDPPSPTSSSSSSLFTPFGSLSSNFLSSSPSSHSSDHMLFSAKESSQFEESINCSRNNLPQDFMDTAAGKTECVALSSVESAKLSNKINALTLPPSDPSSSEPTYEEDFDPYEESSKGLADLIAKEEAHCIPYDTATIPPGFSSVNANRPVQRITPPPGFAHKEMTEEDLANMFMKTKLEIHQAMSSCNRHQDKPIPMSNYPQDNCGVSEEQLLRARKLEDELRAIFPNATVTFGYHEKDNLDDVPSAEIFADSARCPPPYIPPPGTMNWMPPGAVAENALGVVPSAEIFADSVRCPPCIPPPGTMNWLPPGAVAENTLGGHWLPYSQFPPPGFLRPYISAPFIPFQHFGANYSETESGHDSIDRGHSSV